MAVNQAQTPRGRQLGTLAISFFVIAAAGPLVAMAGGVPVAMLFGNGVGVPGLFLALTVILLLFAAGYTAMAKHILDAGAFYVFAREGLGARAGGAMGLVALVSYSAVQFSLYGLFGAATDGLANQWIGHAIPWWGYSFAAVGFVALAGYRQIDLSLKILGALCTLEYLVVAILDIGIFVHGGREGVSLAPFAWGNISSGAPMIGLLLSFGAFIGFEATTIYSEEALDADRSVPRATYLALLLIGSFYALSTWAVVIGLGVSTATQAVKQAVDPTVILFQLADIYVGPGLVVAMRLLFVTSIFAAILAFHNVIARYFFVLGRDGTLPRSLGSRHFRHGSPHVGSLVQSATALIMIALFAVFGADPVLVVFALLSGVGTLGILLLMVVTAVAVICFFRQRGGMAVWRFAATVLSLVGLGAIAVLAMARFDMLTSGANGNACYLPFLFPITIIAGALLTRPRGVT